MGHSRDTRPLDEHSERVALMLATAKTKAELQDLVRSLDARNVQLQRVRDDLAAQLAQAQLNLGPGA